MKFGSNILFIMVAICIGTVGAQVAEWDCSTTTGVFKRSTDCTISSQIIVTDKLNITGVPDSQQNPPKIIPGVSYGSNRFFKVENGGLLVVKHVDNIAIDDVHVEGTGVFCLYINDEMRCFNASHMNVCDSGYGEVRETTWTCKICSHGKYSTGGTAVSCENCPSGTPNTYGMPGQASCTASTETKCDAGWGTNVKQLSGSYCVNPITSEAECREAAERAGKEFGATVNYGHVPKACYKYSNGGVDAICRDCPNNMAVCTGCSIPSEGNWSQSGDCILGLAIVITDKLNIIGIADTQGNLPKVIGGGSNRFFKVESSGELVLRNLNLTEGVAEHGGAIHSSGKLKLVECIVQNNMASHGGALYIARGNFYSINTTYVGNIGNSSLSTSSTYKSTYGSVIRTWDNRNTGAGANVYFIGIKSIFRNNVLTGQNLVGGVSAFCCSGKFYFLNYQHDNVENGVSKRFSDTFKGTEGTIVIPQNCSAAPRQCQDSGYPTNYVCADKPNPNQGVLCKPPCNIPTSGRFTISQDCIQATQINVVDFLEVVGILSADGRLPKVHGGGSNRFFNVNGGQLVLESLELTGGKHNHEGGAIKIYSGAVNLNNCLFNENSAGACGAMKANDGATLISVNTTYSYNSADAILYGSKNAIGGAICTWENGAGDDINLYILGGNSLFFGNKLLNSENKPNKNEGVVCENLPPPCSILRAGNFTITSDCVMYYEIVVTGKLNVTGVPNADGVLPKLIGAGHNRLFKVESGGELVVKSLNLTGGAPSTRDYYGWGGAVLVFGSFNTISSFFWGNEGYRGGAILGKNSGSNIQIFNSTISHNVASYGAGLYAHKYSKLYVIDSKIEHNVGRNGGGILCESAMICNIYDSFISSNVGTSSSNPAGGLWIEDSSVAVVRDTFIIGNSAPNKAGGDATFSHSRKDEIPTIFLLNVDFGNTTNNNLFAGYGCNGTNGYCGTQSCKTAPTQCQDNGYSDAYACVDKSNPNEGVECTTKGHFTHLSPTNHTTSGGVLTHFYGHRFVNATTTIKTNSLDWTHITWHNDTWISAVSPAGTGKAYAVVIVIDSIVADTTEIQFSYAPPQITSTVAPGFGGGSLQLSGLNFGADKNKIEIMTYEDGGCSRACDSPEITANGVTCTFTGQGIQGTRRGVEITVDGQTSARGEFRYDVDRGDMVFNGMLERVKELESFEYTVGLSKGVSRTKNVTVEIAVDSTACTLSTRQLLFVPSDEQPKTVTVFTTGNRIDEGRDAVFQTCQLFHKVNSTDPSYKTAAASTKTVQIINEDVADVRLWMINPTTKEYSYGVRFIPFFVQEGSSVSYGVRLDTIPKKAVVVKPSGSLNKVGLLQPPQITISPASLTFDATNWNITQDITITLQQNDVDHDVETFEIAHAVATDDTVFLAEATRASNTLSVAIDANNDDTAGINLAENKGLRLTEGSAETDSITIASLNSQPVHDVNIHVNSPANMKVTPALPTTISKANWKDTKVTITFQALKGITEERPVITVIAISDDSKYNGTALSINALVQLLGKMPETNIIAKPPINSAWSYASFTIQSPSADVASFEWRVDTGEYATVTAVDGSSSVHLPSLDYGVHRFEARAVLVTGALDPTPASYDWTIAHCNDGNRVPEQYASIESNGALTCIDCPHAVGSNCKTQDVTWEGVYANKGWWTAGDAKDTYYKCPFKTACLGGQTISTKHNGTVRDNTTKSRCNAGYAGVVCAICDKGYYLMDDLCLPCLPANGGAETLVIVVFGGAFGLFMFLLVHQMRVRDSKWYWKRLMNAGKKNNALDTDSLRKKDKLGKHLKIFVGFIQILSVSDSAYKIPWPQEFLNFLRIMTPVNFDFLSMSGVGCLVEYNFFHSYTTMMMIPICVSVFVYVTYIIGLKRHEHHFKKRFTHAMRTHYTNHVLQFTMWIVLIIYPPLSRRSLEYFNCSGNIDGKYYLTKDYTIECFTGEWNAMLPVAIVSVAIYPLGIPALFAFQLWKHRKKLDDDAVLARYGFLYEPYQREAFLWDIWEMLRKLLLTGVIVLIFPGKSFQVVFIALCNICFLTFLTIEKPHVPGAGRTLAFLASFAITFTMMLGLVLKTVEDAQAYSGFLAFLLISVNCTVALYTLKLIVMSLCGHRCARKKVDKTVVMPSNTIAHRVKHFLAEMEKEDLIFLSEEQILHFLKMSQKERDAYAARGERQQAFMTAFNILEKQMTSIESQERQTGKTSKVLRLLSNSGGKHNVDELKNIRKEYGAQSKEYKNALNTLDK
eukprot:g3556.t1